MLCKCSGKYIDIYFNLKITFQHLSLSIYLSVYLSIYLFIGLSLLPFLSVCLSFMTLRVHIFSCMTFYVIDR